MSEERPVYAGVGVGFGCEWIWWIIIILIVICLLCPGFFGGVGGVGYGCKE